MGSSSTISGGYPASSEAFSSRQYLAAQQALKALNSVSGYGDTTQHQSGYVWSTNLYKGNATITAGSGNDTVGMHLASSITGGVGRNIIGNSAGDNILPAGRGSSTVFGGASPSVESHKFASVSGVKIDLTVKSQAIFQFSPTAKGGFNTGLGSPIIQQSAPSAGQTAQQMLDQAKTGTGSVSLELKDGTKIAFHSTPHTKNDIH